MKKKKVLLSMLCAASLAAAATGFAACKDTETNTADGNKVNQEIYSVYESYVAYAEANGNAPMSYDDWLNSIKGQNGANGTNGEDGRGIDHIEANSDGDLVIHYTDDTQETVIMPKTFKAFAVDEDGEPVKDAWLGLCYYDETTYSTVTVAEGKTNLKGEVSFKTIPVSGIEYFVSAARNVDNPLPDGYQVSDFQSSFDSNREAVFRYINTRNTVDFRYATATVFPYSRVYSATEKISDTESRYVGSPEDGLRYVSSSFINETNYTRETAEGYLNFAIDYAARAVNWRTTASDIMGTSGTKVSTGSISQADLEVKIKAGGIKYFNFNPSVNPVNVSGAEGILDTISWNHTLAAKGKYRIHVTGGRLYQFDNNYFNLDERGVPNDGLVNYISGDAPSDATAEQRAKYTGEDYITYNLYTGQNNGDNGNATSPVYFYVENEGEEEITVTVSIERIGESDDATSENGTVNLPAAGTEKFADSTSGTLTLMPMNGSLTLVKGDDGFYHINSKTGPYLLVNFNKTIARASDKPLSKANTSELGDKAFQFSDIDDGDHVDSPSHTVRYDYVAFVAAYSKLANSDGVYPVNDDIKEFLEHFGGGQATSLDPDLRPYNYLAYCQYYMPEGGLPLAGAGTQEDPYILTAGDNNVTATGASYAKYTAPEDGFYTFTSAKTLTFTGATPYHDADAYYVYLEKGSAIVIGIPEATTVKVAQTETVSPLEDLDNGNQGTDENSAIAIKFGTTAVKIDKDQCKDGVYVRFTPPLIDENDKGTFVFTPQNAGGAEHGIIVWNGKTFDSAKGEALVVELGANESCVFLVKSDTMNTGDMILITVSRDDNATPTPNPAS